MVGFTPEKQRRLFSVLSAVLLLGNVEFQPKKSAYHHDESVAVKNPDVVAIISDLLRVKQETLMQALTAKRARASGETLVINYRQVVDFTFFIFRLVIYKLLRKCSIIFSNF